MQIKDQDVIYVGTDDINKAYVTKAGYSTPAAIAISRELGRACYINRMGFVCDMWIGFALISPAVYRLMQEWEYGKSIHPFIFDIHLMKEFEAYPGGTIIDVKKEPKTVRVDVSTQRKPFKLGYRTIKQDERVVQRCLAMEGQ